MLGWVARPAFANIILWSAFTSKSMWQYIDDSQGSKIGTAQEPAATSRPSSRDVVADALGLGPNALSCPNPTPQNAIGVWPSAFGGFGTHAPGPTSKSILSRLHLQRETCRNGCGKTTSMIPLMIFAFGEFSSPDELLGPPASTR